MAEVEMAEDEAALVRRSSLETRDDEWIDAELRLLHHQVEEETAPERLIKLAERLEQLAALRRRRG